MKKRVSFFLITFLICSMSIMGCGKKISQKDFRDVKNTTDRIEEKLDELIDSGLAKSSNTSSLEKEENATTKKEEKKEEEKNTTTNREKVVAPSQETEKMAILLLFPVDGNRYEFTSDNQVSIFSKPDCSDDSFLGTNLTMASKRTIEVPEYKTYMILLEDGTLGYIQRDAFVVQIP